MPTIPELLQSALEFHQAGYLPRAEQIYRQILSSHPDDMDTNHLLGILLTQAGHAAAALPHLRRAVALGSQHAMFHSSLGDALRAAGKIDEAIAAYQQAARLEPQSSEHPGKLGILLQSQKRYDEALAQYERAIAINPQDIIACNNAGSICLEKRDFPAARTWFERALAVNPEFPEALTNLGTTLRELKEWKTAEASLQHALRLRPEFAEAHKQLGVLYGQSGNVREAVRCMEQAVRLAPTDHEVRDLLGVAYNTLDRLADAASQLEEAIRLKPDFADAFANLGLSYGAQGLIEQAESAFAKALELGAGDGVRIRTAILCPVVAESTEAIPAIRQGLSERIAALMKQPLAVRDPIEEVCRIAFYPAYHGLNDRQLQRELASLFLHATPSLGYVAPHCQSGTRPVVHTDDKVHVAFVSRYFYNHSVGIHNLGLIRDLPRDRLHVTLVRFSEDEDRLAEAIRQAADETITLIGPLASWRETMAARQFDIICYADLGMDPSTYFLAFARLAPVQCVLPGHPVTTGIPAIDYYISNAELEPDNADEHYSERLVRLRNLPTAFGSLQRWTQPSPRSQFGLAEDAHLYVCPQMPFKIHPEFDSLAREILRRDPKGQLIMFHDQDRKWSPLLMERLKHGLGDVADRVVFLQRLSAEGFYLFLGLCDVLLDSVHFSGGTTSCQALSLGVPVVTLPGQFMRGRVTYALYRRLGVLDCIARDREEYVQIALRLASDRAWRDSIVARIKAAAPAVFSGADSARELGDFFLSVAPRR